MTDKIKYPDIDVCLSECDGNAFAILAAVSRALRAAHVNGKEIEEFKQEAMSSNYDHLLQTCMKWVSVS